MSKPLQLIRHYATPTATPSSSRLVASLILSRSPLTLPPLKPFEAAYYKYANTVQTAQADDFDQSFYFRKGSQAEKSFLNAQSASPAEANEVVEGASMQDLNRLSDRTLYLLLKKKGRTRENGLWQFPQGGIESADSSILSAALRETTEEVSSNLDLFTPSTVPIASYSYTPKKGSPTKVFYLPARLLRGQAQITAQGKKEGIVEFAWCSKEEVKERIAGNCWVDALKEGELLAN